MFDFFIVEYSGSIANSRYGFQVDEGELPRTRNDVIERILERVHNYDASFTESIRVTFVGINSPAKNITDQIVSSIVADWNFSDNGDIPANSFLAELEGKKVGFDHEVAEWDAHCKTESAPQVFL